MDTLEKPKRRRVDVAVDRLPPQDIESEQGVISCMMQSRDAIFEAVERLQSDDFYDLRHARLFEVIAAMAGNSVPIDIITLQSALKAENVLEGVGGISYLTSLEGASPAAGRLPNYAGKVLDASRLRRVIQRSVGLVNQAYEPGANCEQIESEAYLSMLEFSGMSKGAEFQTSKELVAASLADMEAEIASAGKMTGLATGFPDLDRMTWGLQSGEMIVIAARPGAGKTSIAMNFVDNAAVNQGYSVGVFSMEMSARSLIKRMICSRARVNHRRIREGLLSASDFPKITDAAMRISTAKVHICDQSSLSIAQLSAKARRMFDKFGISLFVIDYLQLMTGTGQQKKRHEEIAEISRGIKAVARDLNVPVLVLAQLNREGEKGTKPRKPRISDLREGGSIEADADTIGLLSKNEAQEESEDSESVAIDLEIAKQRNGPTGIVRLTFFKGYTRFESASKIAAEDAPTNQPYRD